MKSVLENLFDGNNYPFFGKDSGKYRESFLAMYSDHFIKKPFHLTSNEILELAKILFPAIFASNNNSMTNTATILSVRSSVDEFEGFDIWLSHKSDDRKQEFKCTVSGIVDFIIRPGSDEDRRQGKDEDIQSAFDIPIIKIFEFLLNRSCLLPCAEPPVINPVLIQPEWTAIYTFKNPA